jgi:hypothetical protein
MMRTNDGEPVTATNPVDIVRELHKMSNTPCGNDRDFMADTAKRVRSQFAQEVRTDCPKHFVEDLVKIGLLVQEEKA